MSKSKGGASTFVLCCKECRSSSIFEVAPPRAQPVFSIAQFSHLLFLHLQEFQFTFLFHFFSYLYPTLAFFPIAFLFFYTTAPTSLRQPPYDHYSSNSSDQSQEQCVRPLSSQLLLLSWSRLSQVKALLSQSNRSETVRSRTQQHLFQHLYRLLLQA
jgi:hypothetical protein